MTVELFNLYAGQLRPLFRVKAGLDQLDRTVKHGLNRPDDRQAVEAAIKKARRAIIRCAATLAPPTRSLTHP